MEKKLNKFEKFTKEFYDFDITVSGYTNDFVYRDDEIISQAVESSEIMLGITPITGIKAGTTKDINFLIDDVVWNNGACGVTAAGTSTLAPRTVAVSYIYDRFTMCTGDLSQKIPQLLKAGAYDENLGDGLMNHLVQHRVDVNAKYVEKALFLGDTVSGTGNMAKVNGLLAIAGGETGDLAHYGTFSGFTSGNAVATIETIATNRSDVSFEIEDFTIYVSLSDFSIIKAAYLAAFPTMINGSDVYFNEKLVKNTFRHPVENIMIKGTHALTGNGSAFAMPYSEMRYAVDLQAELQAIDVFYEKKDKKYYFDIIFGLGFQYIDPANVIYIEKVV